MLLNAVLSTEVVKANSNKAQTFQLADKKTVRTAGIKLHNE